MSRHVEVDVAVPSAHGALQYSHASVRPEPISQAVVRVRSGFEGQHSSPRLHREGSVSPLPHVRTNVDDETVDEPKISRQEVQASADGGPVPRKCPPATAEAVSEPLRIPQITDDARSEGPPDGRNVRSER